ncbi:SusC/RagA family TonB-linked outer membrane protein [Niastella caeni]|nr:SusC/RagA family TonB-linked outer membrane protein [Niastella caeni]
MKLTVILLTVAMLQVNANGFSQTITFSGKNVPLEKIFSIIKTQAGFGFFYFDEQLKDAKKVTINVKNAAVEEVLSICMKDQPYDYTIKGKTIFIINKQKKEKTSASAITNEQGDKRINISGRVTGEQGEPVIGATITIKGTEVATTTNERGQFTLNDVDEDAVLIITNVSYQSQEIALRGRSSVEVRMRVNAGNLDEAVVVAYNTTTQRKNVGAVTVVKGEQIATLPNRSFDKSLQGLVPGLLVTSGTSLPGGGVGNFILRGIATAADPINGSTVRNPLIVVDGVPISQDQFQTFIEGPNVPISNPLAQLNTSDIETISVLKDASAIALYGSRASNGVIVITTKRGKAGKTNFSFRHQTDLASRYMGKTKMLNQQEYLDLLFESYRNLNSPDYPDDASIYADLRKKFPVIVNAPGDTSFYPQADWYGELFRKTALTFSNELSMSGGSEKSNFYLNLEYTKQNGIVKATGYDRKSLRFNFENRPATWLKLGINSTLSYNVQDYGGSNRSYNGTVVNHLSPLNPIRDTDGNYVLNYRAGGGPSNASLFANPAAQAEFNTNRNTAYRGLTNLNGEISFLKYFKFNTIAGVDFMLTEAKEKADPRMVDIGGDQTTISGIGRVEEQSLRRINLISTNMMRYIRTFHNDHAINLLIGQEAQIQTQKHSLIAVKRLSLPYYDQINSNGVLPLRQSVGNFKETLLSFFGQANYGFKNKYFLSGSVRKDGSSRFGKDKQYGTYWSAGAGWVVTGEEFMKGSSSWLNYLKLRGSVGAAGNAGAINAVTKFDEMNSLVFLGGTAMTASDRPGNPDIKWEQTFSWDAGLETRLWKERISFTADVYKRKTKDLIYLIPLVASTGYTDVLQNIGEIENHGVELSLSVNVIKNRNWSWIIDANWSTNQNKLVKANVPVASLFLSTIGNKEGENFNSFYMPIWAGVNAADGSPQWLDSAGNVVTAYPGAIKHRKFVGKPQPDGFGGVSTRLIYKAFEFSARFYYQYGYQLMIQDDLVSDGAIPYINQDRRALDRWQKPGDNATNPKRILNNPSGSATYRPSTRYLFDGDHIRLQNVTITYNVPKAIVERLHMTGIRLLVQGNNLGLRTKYPGMDPDLVNTIGGTDISLFPSQRSFSFGINANF